MGQLPEWLHRGFTTSNYAVTQEPNSNTESLPSKQNKSSVVSFQSLEKLLSEHMKKPPVDPEADAKELEGRSRLFF